MAFTYPLVLAFIDKRVIRAAAGPYILRRFDQPVAAEVDVPIVLRCCFCNPLRLFYRLACARLLVGKLDQEPIWRAIRRESNESFMRVAFFEMPHPPCVEREDFFFENSAKLRLAAPLELNKILDLLIGVEVGCLIKCSRRPGIFLGQRVSRLESISAIHLQLDIDEREGGREISERKDGCAGG